MKYIIGKINFKINLRKIYKISRKKKNLLFIENAILKREILSIYCRNKKFSFTLTFISDLESNYVIYVNESEILSEVQKEKAFKSIMKMFKIKPQKIQICLDNETPQIINSKVNALNNDEVIKQYQHSTERSVNILLFPFKLIFKLLNAIVLIFLGSNKISKIQTITKGKTYYEKKKSGFYTSRGGIKVLGGTLPKRSSSGSLEFLYDGKNRPSRTGTRGGKSVYKTDGNVQVFYRDSKDIENIEFVALSVDYYKK